MSHGHVNKVTEHVSCPDHNSEGGIPMLWNGPRGGKILIWDLDSGSRLELAHKSLCAKLWHPLRE